MRVVLRTLEKRQNANPSYSIFDYLIDEVRQYCESDSSLAISFLQQMLHLGKAIIIFDGLDEILEVGARRLMCSLIEQFSHTYEPCPVLVTSRIVGYRDAPLSPDFELHTLARFNREEVKDFSSKLIRVINQEAKSAAESKARDFIRQTEGTANDLRENPLLLGLMVYIFMARGDVPNNRPEIYRECSLLMFEKWDQRRDIIFKFPQDFDLLDLFGFLASKIFGDAEAEYGVSEDWLTKQLRQYFTVWYEDRAKSVQASKALVDFITGRAWVMCEVGPGTFKFTHRTFLEYFFARRIEEEAGGVISLVSDQIVGKAYNAEWDVVSHLALQIATYRSAPKSLQALLTLIDNGDKWNEDISKQQNYLDFLGRSLEYLTLPESNLIEAINFIFDRVIVLSKHAGFDGVEVVHSLLTACNKRSELVQRHLNAILAPVLEGESNDQRYFALRLIGTRYYGFRSGNGRNASAIIWTTFGKLRKKCKNDQYVRATKNLNEAQAYIEVYRDSLSALYAYQGLSLLTGGERDEAGFDFNPLGGIILAASLTRVMKTTRIRFDGLEFEEDDLANLIGLVASDLRGMWESGEIWKLESGTSDYHFLDLLGIVLEDFINEGTGRVRRSPKGTRLSECFLVYISLHLFSLRNSKGTSLEIIETIKTGLPNKREALEDLVEYYSCKLAEPQLEGAIRDLGAKLSAEFALCPVSTDVLQATN
ncbi:hypothetical protein P5P81_20790 [Tritonibacter mobilis]|nr:hypothetical protein [Tritonibacter mobilis]